MTKKSFPVPVDAVSVIYAHEQCCRELLCNHYQIALPATILEEEVFYFHMQGRKQGLVPSRWVKEGKVERLEASVDDYKNLESKLSKDFIDSLDPGELEALALLGSKNYKNYLFNAMGELQFRLLMCRH